MILSQTIVKNNCAGIRVGCIWWGACSSTKAARVRGTKHWPASQKRTLSV